MSVIVSAAMRVPVAILLALSIVAAQFVYGGQMRTAFSLPCYALLAVAGILGGCVLFWKRAAAPRLEAVIATLLAGAFLLWRSLHSPGQDLALFYTFLVTACVVVYCLCACVVTSATSRYVLIALLLPVAIWQVLVAGIQFSEAGDFWPLPWFSGQIQAWYSRPEADSGFAHGLFLCGGHLAWFLNAAAFLVLGIASFGRFPLWARLALGYIAAVCATGTILTLSRGGMAGLAVGMVVFLLLSLVVFKIADRDQKLVNLLVILAVFAAALSGGYFFFSRSPSTQASLSKTPEDSHQAILWPAVLRQAQLHPLTGTGAGSFTRISRRLGDAPPPFNDTYAHNDWAQAVADFGLIGLVLIAGAFIANWRAGYRGFVGAIRQRVSVAKQPQSNSAAIGIGALSALAACGVHSLFDFSMQVPANALLAAACAGMLANSGISHRDRGGWKQMPRWLAGTASLAAGFFLAILLFGHAKAEWCALRAENALCQGDFDTAVILANQGLERIPSHALLHRLLGEASVRAAASVKNPQENYELSADQLRMATEIDPDERWNQLMLAISLTNLRQQKAAEEAYIEAIRLDPKNPAAYEYYGFHLESEGKTDEAKRTYEVSLQIPGTKFAAKRLRALCQKEKMPQTR